MKKTLQEEKQRILQIIDVITEQSDYASKTFKSKLNESKIYVKSSEIPSQILSWATSYLGKGFENKITIEKVNDKLIIGTPWHDADREIHQFFRLTPEGTKEVGDPVSKTGWSEMSMFNLKDGTVKIPSGYVLATAGTYPKRLRISVSDDAMNIIPDNKDTVNKLSDDAFSQHFIKQKLLNHFTDKNLMIVFIKN